MAGNTGTSAASASKNSNKCLHYTRSCKLKAPCCNEFFACRFCHDDVKTHEMNRFDVKQILCTACKTVQGINKVCKSCGLRFGEYFCRICRLYDVDNKQYHCFGCGLCRVGPKENFFHCNKCCACLSIKLKDHHKCVENAAKSSCPICQEYLHTSRDDIFIPKCGHMIHNKCSRDCLKQNIYQCPTCKESLFDMSDAWRELDAICASVQMPPEIRNLVVNILCQDCHQICDQKFNTEGLKCVNCGSYNTTRT